MILRNGVDQNCSPSMKGSGIGMIVNLCGIAVELQGGVLGNGNCSCTTGWSGAELKCHYEVEWYRLILALWSVFAWNCSGTIGWSHGSCSCTRQWNCAELKCHYEVEWYRNILALWSEFVWNCSGTTECSLGKIVVAL